MMTRRRVDLDDDLLENAKREFGTTALADTLHTALRVATAIRVSRRQLECLAEGDNDNDSGDRHQLDLDVSYLGSQLRQHLRTAVAHPGGPRPTRT